MISLLEIFENVVRTLHIDNENLNLFSSCWKKHKNIKEQNDFVYVTESLSPNLIVSWSEGFLYLTVKSQLMTTIIEFLYIPQTMLCALHVFNVNPHKNFIELLWLLSLFFRLLNLDSFISIGHRSMNISANPLGLWKKGFSDFTAVLNNLWILV